MDLLAAAGPPVTAMIVVVFDPIAKEVLVQLDAHVQPVAFYAERVLFKHYGDEGVFFAETHTPDAITVGLIPIEGEPLPIVTIAPGGGLTWHVGALASA